MVDIETKTNYFHLYIFINLALYITYFQIENVNYFWFINNIFINVYIINYTNKLSKNIILNVCLMHRVAIAIGLRL